MSVLRCVCLMLAGLARLAEAELSADERPPVFAAGAVPEELWNAGEFTEGVAVRSDGLVFFSDIPMDPQARGRILVFDPAAQRTRVFCANSGKSNGLAFDSGDRLLACCGANGGLRALCEVTDGGELRTLVAEFQGQPLNAPNDLVVHPQGAIYFTDPRYVGPEPLGLPGMWVFRFEPRTQQLTVATRELQKPNGVEVSPDGRTLYVAETDNGASGIPEAPPGKPGQMLLTAFAVAADGSLSNRRVLVDFGRENGIDGMAVDSAGRIFAAVRSAARFGIAVYAPDGQELAFLKTPGLPTNCAFGVGNDARTLYITAGGGLYRVTVSR